MAQTPGLTKRAVGRETPLAVSGTIRITQGKEGAESYGISNELKRVVNAGASVR